MKGKLIIITGFSGAGKDTIKNKLLEVKPNLTKIVTHTTRAPRVGEIHGEDLYFIDVPTFENMVLQDHFFEYVKYGSDYKGTTKKEFEKVLAGQTVIWRIDMSRTALIEETFREKLDKETAEYLISATTKILIKTPSTQDAIERYKKRENNQADIAEFEKRLKEDEAILSTHSNRFPNIINNEFGKLDKAIEDILSLIK